MIRKNVTLILAVVLVMAMLAGLPIVNAVSHNSTTAASYSSAALYDDVPTPTATPGGSIDSNPSGGGNGG